MTTLKIKLADIIDALTTGFEMVKDGFYLDIETGDILLSSEGRDADSLPET